MEKWFNKVAIVTGASEGIGKDIALKLVEYGLIVIGCGRHLGKLEEVKKSLQPNTKGEFVPFKCDVSIEEDVLKMFNFVKSTYKELSICINNAAISIQASILEGKTEDWKQIQDINILGVCMCTREAVNLMKENEDKETHEVPGHIINISSMAAHVVYNLPTAHFYTATKFALKAITEGTRQELLNIKSNIRVCEISPGGVDTNFASKSGIRAPGNYSRLNVSDVTDAVIHVLSAPANTLVREMLITPLNAPL